MKPIPEQRLRDERETLKDSLSDHNAWEAGHETGEELHFLRPGRPRTPCASCGAATG